jgi:GAF domain-containing protein
MEDRANTSEILLQIQQDVDTAFSLQEVLDRILRRAVQLVDARDGSLMLLDEKGELSFRARVGGPSPQDKGERSFKLGEGIAGWVAQNRKYYICADTKKDPAFTPIISGSPIRSLVVVPIISHGEVLGVINVDSPQPDHFRPASAELLMTLASQTAVAIERAALFEVLREISSMVSSPLDLKEVAGKILDEMGKVVKYRSASLQLIQKDNRTQVAGRGFKKKTVPKWALRPISQDRLIKRVVDNKKPVILSNLSDLSKVPEWSFHKETADVKSWVGLPLVYGEEVIGLLTLDHDQPGFYTPAAEDLLVALANQAAIAVKNKRLLEDAQRRIRDMEIVNEVTQVVNTQLSPQAVFHAIVSQIAKQLNCTHCTIFLPAEESGELVLKPQATSGGRQQVMERRFKPGEGLAGWVFQKGQSVALENVMEDGRFAPARERQGKPRSMLVAPVKVGDQAIGVISADQDEYGWFSDNDRLLLDALAQQAGIAIQRSVGLGLLQDIGNRIISAREECEILESIVSGAIKLTNTTSGVIYLIDEDGQSVTEDYHYPQDFQPPPLRLKQGEGLTYRIIADRKPIAIPDIEQDERANRDLLELGIRSIIGIPLSLTERVIGVLYLNDNDRHNFTETEISLLSTLASQAAISIEKAGLIEEATERAEEMAFANRLGQELSAMRDIKEIPRLLVKETIEQFNAQAGSLALVSEESGEIEFQFALDYEGSEKSSDRLTRYKMPLGEGIAGWVVQHRQPVISNNAQGDPRWHKEADGAIGFTTKSVLAVPLIYSGRVMGVIEIVNKRDGKPFSERERDCLSTLALSAAIAIENARLIERERQRADALDLLQKVSGKISSTLDLDSTLELIVTGAMQLTGMNSGVIHLVNESGQFISRSFEFPAGFKHPVPRLSEKESMTRTIIDTGQAIAVPDITQQKLVSKIMQDRGIKSLIGLPLKRDERVIGVLYLNADQPRQFTSEERSLLLTLADHAAIAIENARLYETMRGLNAQLESLHRVAQGHNLGEVLDQTVKGIGDLLGEETSPTINLYDKETDSFGECHAYGPLRVKLMTPPRSAGGTGKYVLTTGKPLYLEDVQNPPPGHPTVRAASIALGIQSFAAIPLKGQDRMVGVLFVNLQKPFSFSEEIKRVLELFASQAAIAIENARLYAELAGRIKQLEVLPGIYEKIIAAGIQYIDGILDLLHEETSKIMDLGDAMFYVAFYDEKKDEVSFGLAIEQDNGQEIERIRWGKRIDTVNGEAEAEKVPQWMPRARRDPPGLTEYVIRKKEPMLISEKFEEWARVELGVQVWSKMGKLIRPTMSWLGVPMLVGGRVIGMISIQSLERERAFDQSHLELLATVANQAAVAIENARLLDRQTKWAQQLAGLQEVGVKITSQLELKEVLGSIVEQTRATMLADFCTLLPYDSERGKFESGIRRGRIEVEPSIPSNSGFSAHIAKTQEPAFIEDVNAMPSVNPTFIQNKNVKSFAGVPLVYGERTVGVLYINFFEPHSFSDEEKEIMRLLANQAAVAIENAQLYTHLEERTSQLRGLHEISVKITSRLELDDVLLSIAQTVRELLKADASTLFPYDAAQQEFSNGVRAGKINERLTRPSSQGMASRLMKEPTPVFKSAREMGTDERLIIDGKPVLSYAGIPLIFEQKCVGLLFVNYFRDHLFSENERDLVQMFGLQAANAINNARQYEIAQKLAKLEHWAQIGQLAGSLAHRIGNTGGTIRLRANELAEYLSDRLPNDPIVQNTIEPIIRNNQYLLDLSTVLFKPSQAFEERMALSDIALLVNGAVNNAEIPKDVKVEIHLPAELPPVNANRFFVEVFVEIIANAIQAMQNSATKLLTVSAEHGDNWVNVSFTDTGFGIPEEKLSGIFGLFTPRAERKKGKHLGFGLWWVKTFLRDIGGDIKIKSQVNKGTTVTVQLPRG